MFVRLPAFLVGPAFVGHLFGRRLCTIPVAVTLLLSPGARGQSDSTEHEVTTDPAERLDAVNVSDARYKPLSEDVPAVTLPWLGFSLNAGGIGVPPMAKYIVTASRTPQPPERVAASAQVFDETRVAATPAVTLDAALRSAPSFSLFRRGDSLTAHPTSQGVSLRGVGPSGASRSLVLLDGVPLNDPFGGWINWAKVPRDSVGKVEVVPGGGAAAWGNSALSGAVQILTVPPRLTFTIIDRPPEPMKFGWRGTARTSLTVGDFGLLAGTVGLIRPAGAGVVQVFAEEFSFGGYRIVAPEYRGAVDVPAWSRHRSLAVRYRTPAGPNSEITAAVRGFEEFRGNGTPYQRNQTREKFASLQFAAQPSDHFTWQATGYAQAQTFASTFSSINAARSGETPASDQFAVPATALGLGSTGTWTHRDGSRSTIGIDGRWVNGETRENYSYSAGTFLRERVAGGSQEFIGAFGMHEHPLTKTLRLTIGARIDQCTDANGHRRERDRATGVLSRDERYATRDDLEFSPNLGFVWLATTRLRLRGNAQHSFRRPTLNELYRPFRQGPNVIEANPALATERSTAAELGGEIAFRRRVVEPVRSGNRRGTTVRDKTWLTLSATAFHNELRDAVTNVTIARGPGTFPLFGSLGPGAVGRQRLNVDRTIVQGGEISARWQLADRFEFTTSYLHTDAAVRRAAVAPGLVGKRLAEVPRHSASITGTWKAPGRLTVTPRLRWIGPQFDDDENTLRLGEAVVTDVGVTFSVNKNLELFLNAENIGNARIETARTADGVVSTGTPRFVFGGVRGRW